MIHSVKMDCHPIYFSRCILDCLLRTVGGNLGLLGRNASSIGGGLGLLGFELGLLSLKSSLSGLLRRSATTGE
jgi:hypothetical protein